MAPLRFSLSTSMMALALGIGMPAHAQSADTTAAPAAPQTPKGADSLPGTGGPMTIQSGEGSEIVVTGSRLRGAAPVGSSVISLGRGDVVASGAVTTDRLIKQIPQVFDLGVSENSRGQSGGNGNITYGNSINLRGIGPYATLILVDGHRAVNNSRAFDPSAIPTLGLERVEVIADGASAIYGSDAVAGVVNLIPRRTLNGGEVLARAGVSDDGRFSEYQTGAALGKVWSTGQFMAAVEWVRRSRLSGDDRSFFRSDQRAFGGRDYRVSRCNPGTITAGGVNYAIPQAGVTPATAGSLVAGTSNLCNDIQGQDLFPRQQYISSNFTFTQDLNDWLTVFADGFFTRRTFSRNPAAASATLTVPQTNAFFVRPPGFTGTSYTLGYNFVRDLPLAEITGQSRNWEVTPGVRIKLPHDWRFEGLFTYGRGNDQSNQYVGLNNAALNAALASNNPATAFDPYGLGRTSAATLAAINNFISFSPTLNQFNGYEARLNGTILTLPGGDVKLAAGYEGQKITTKLGSARGVTGTSVVFREFHREVNSGYGEVLVPIFGAGNAIPGFQRLEIDAAVRYDKYSDVGHTTNPKFGVNWSPVRTLTLRGSYGTSFRAPLISQIYGNSNNLFIQTYQNPAGPPIVGVALSGPNTNLSPEKAKTWSAGADWDVTPRLRLSATYFNVKYTNQVDTYLADLAILSREAQFAGTGIILRGDAARDRVLALLAQGITLGGGGAFPGGSPNNVTLFVDGRNNNLGVSYTEGIDFVANWRVPTANIGTFDLNANATYLTRFEAAISPAGALIDRRNTIFFPLKFKARASVTWDLGAIRTQLTATHVGRYTNNAVAPIEKVKSYTPIDFSIGFAIDGDGSKRITGGKLIIGLEVRNLFDIKPPYVNIAPSGNGSGGYDATVANPVGRTLAVSARKTW